MDMEKGLSQKSKTYRQNQSTSNVDDLPNEIFFSVLFPNKFKCRPKHYMHCP